MSFDTLAPFYRGMEWLFAGRLLQAARMRFIAETGHCRKALVLGEGPGSFLVELLEINPHVEVVCVERSRGMIRQARKRLRSRGLNPGRVQFIESDVWNWLESDHAKDFDLIATHYFLDCFSENELGELIRLVGSAAAPGALWLVSDFNIPHRGLGRIRAKIIVLLLYLLFHLTTDLEAWSLVAPEAFLRAAGFSMEQNWTANFGLVHASLWRKTAENATTYAVAETGICSATR